MAERILGMGDVVSLVEERKSSLTKKKPENTKKIAKNEFGFDDFFPNSASEENGMKDLVGMIPGASKAMKDVEIEDDALNI
jgi:signal recognition particle subunit SRP54